MEAFLVSTGVVALAEMGDKTQLLSLLLAARYRQPVAIILGILCATLANHAAAAALGAWITAYIGYDNLRWIIGISFIGMALWMLIPDRLDDTAEKPLRLGVFATTVVAFFLAEMGDKTQVATVALAAQYTVFYSVVAGTTLGMMLANVPAVLLGEGITRKLPLPLIHGAAALIFVVLGAVILMNANMPN
ncbi:MAG: TMEM165/GDT1 family protein [Gammaproteobacteria bacterium]|nr:TMEM165/GDT1 family protein [Gammaproteobacteria bacterium]